MAGPADGPPWVIVAGGFHQRGGMDRANAALASFLLDAGARVHLVGHEIDEPFRAHPLATVHPVPRPRALPDTAERLLARAGMRTARRVVASAPGARVVVNGGNCPWPDVNWVHALHAAWPVHDEGSPWWSRYRLRRLKRVAERRERAGLARARLVIANSDGTRREIVTRIGVPPERVHTVYLGTNPEWGQVALEERAAARRELALPHDAPVVLFVGALGTDINKGFDVLWAAWRLLAQSPGWDSHLVVAGGGWRAARWRDEARRSDWAAAVHFLGFTSRVREVLAAGDLLVSPVRYEAYGLNVHEALCRGLAVMVTESAGIAERFGPGMSEALLPDGVSAQQLAARLRAWRGDVAGWRTRAAFTAARLRGRSWTDMAAELVDIVGRTRENPPA